MCVWMGECWRGPSGFDEALYKLKPFTNYHKEQLMMVNEEHLKETHKDQVSEGGARD